MEIWQKASVLAAAFVGIVNSASFCGAANGSFTLKLVDESTDQPVISRVEFLRGATAKRGRERQMPIRKTVSAGIGVVVDQETLLELPEGPYRFRIVRGPEYRIVSGTFELEKTSLDEKTVALPRMVDMQAEGWLAGDCCIAPSSASVPLRMAAEDLHVAAVLGKRTAKPIPGRDSEQTIQFDPVWIRTDVSHFDGLAFYGLSESDASAFESMINPFQRMVAILADADKERRVAIENPFAWELPVWLASGKPEALFLFGDWLRLDKRVLSIRNGYSHPSFGPNDATAVGRFAEQVYRHILEAGIPIVPFAGGGDQSAGLPIGYNRLYVTSRSSSGSEVEKPSSPDSMQAWWNDAWAGSSVATNGPLLRPRVGGKLPGHVFEAHDGEVLRIQPELNLAVRDQVDYLEVIHNNRVHYSARLDEFAKTGGKIPPIMAKESGWVILRVMTLHDEHYRAAVTAPWWIRFDGRHRVAAQSVAFFQSWLERYEERLKRLPPEQIADYVPFVQAARKFWRERAEG